MGIHGISFRWRKHSLLNDGIIGEIVLLINADELFFSKYKLCFSKTAREKTMKLLTISRKILEGAFYSIATLFNANRGLAIPAHLYSMDQDGLVIYFRY